MDELYANIGWLCFYLSLMSSVSAVVVFPKANLLHTVTVFCIFGSIFALCWPVALPSVAILLPCWIKKMDNQKKKIFELETLLARKILYNNDADD